jgi:gluconokinase
MNPYFLGVDIGTGSTKAVAIDFEGRSVGMSQRSYPVKSPKPGYSEQDPKVILAAFKNCITDITHKLGYAPLAISFSSAMHSVIPVNENGKALMNMMTWADSRSENIARQLRESEKGEAIYKTSGTPIHAMSPLCKVIWLKENNAELFAATHKFISIKEYIWYYLFNEFQVDYSLASATGLFDILKLDWNPEACELAGITSQNLSTSVNTTYSRNGLRKPVQKALNLNPKTHFIIGASDGCCANLGSFVTKPGVASLTIGTSGAIRITSSKPVYDYQAMIFNYLLNQNTFVCGGAVNNGGIALKWLLDSFIEKKANEDDRYAEAFNLIKTVAPGSEGLIFLPYLYGEKAPIWDTKTCGVYFNIKPVHNKAHFLRAGLEGICFALKSVLDTLETSTAKIGTLNISGGFISSPLWMQILSDITGKKLAIVQQEDASAIGAVFLAMDALKVSRTNQKKPVHIVADILPNKTHHKTYNRLFPVFKKLYTDLKSTMNMAHDMNI